MIVNLKLQTDEMIIGCGCYLAVAAFYCLCYHIYRNKKEGGA